jgi:hypothetical protein
MFVAAALAAACAGRAAAPAPPAPEERAGTIRRVGDFGYAVVPDRDPGTRYVPDRPFPSDLQVDGLRVLFSGSEMAPPPGVRLWGTPFRLATIRRAPPGP